MRILVTGGAGFVGSHVVDAYLAAGHEVSVIDNLSTGRKENLNPEATFYEGDLREADFVKEVFAKEKFDVVNHLAAQTSVQLSLKEPAVDAWNNIVGTVNLLEQAQAGGVSHFIYINTGGALYGEATVIPTPEDYPCSPLTPYGLSKLTAERYLEIFHSSFSLPYTVFRCANIYGPRQHPKAEAGVIAIFSEMILKGEHPVIFNDGTNTRDYVYVKDVVSATVAVLKGAQNVAINIGNSTETSANEVFDLVSKGLGANLPRQYGRETIEQRRSCLDISRAKELLGWEPQYTFSQGLTETLDWYRNQA